MSWIYEISNSSDKFYYIMILGVPFDKNMFSSRGRGQVEGGGVPIEDLINDFEAIETMAASCWLRDLNLPIKLVISLPLWPSYPSKSEGFKFSC